jgi:pimeloyl-ACP methyl ester carboxylesterase
MYNADENAPLDVATRKEIRPMNEQKSDFNFMSSFGRVAYTDTGPGAPTLILLHGLPTAKELWSPVLPHLPAEWRIITYDLLDYGQSAKIGHPITHVQRADVLDELRGHLGLDRFVLVAHDLGASVAVDFMGRYGQHVEKLVLVSPPIYPEFPMPAIVRLVRTPGLGEVLVRVAKETLFSIGVTQGLVHKERYTPELRRAFGGAFDGAEGRAALLRNLRWGTPASTFRGYPAILKSIRTPTLIVQGRRDPYIPLAQAERAMRDIPGAKLAIIEDGGHFLPIDTPEAVAARIVDF